MQVHAIYEDGQLTFQRPIRFNAKRIELDVTIPDNYILSEDQVNQSASSNEPNSVLHQGLRAARTQSETGRRLDAIVGPLRGKLGSMSPQEVKAIWHKHLEEKYLGNK